MKKRFQIIILTCVLCTILVGCGSSNNTMLVDSDSFVMRFAIDDIKETLEKENLVSLNGSATIFYYSYNY